MAYTALKPFYTGGRRYRIGEAIDESHVDPRGMARLMRYGCVALVGEAAQGAISPCVTKNDDSHITMPILADEGIAEATMGSQSVVTALTIMQKNVEEASKDIAELEDLDALLILEAADSRKGIQKAAGERNGQLLQAGEAPETAAAGEPPGEDGAPEEKEGRADG